MCIQTYTYIIHIYIYILESTGALRAPLILLTHLPVDVSNVVVRTIDMHFDHKTRDPKSVSGSAQSLKHKVSRMDQETANVNHLKRLEMVTLPDEGLTTSQKLECVSRWGHVYYIWP